MREYHALYADIVVETILRLPKRRRDRLLALCDKLADNPFTRSDYRIKDSDGRDIEHVLLESFVIGYWVDHAMCKVMIVDVDDVR